jgi:hypothetical protein
VPQPPLQDVALLVQSLDVLLAAQEPMPPPVAGRVFSLRVARTLMATLMATTGMMAVAVALARAVVVMTAAAHAGPPFRRSSTAKTPKAPSPK